MNKGDLITSIADETGLTKAQATAALNSTMATISTSLKKKNDVTLIGFGTFTVARRKARKGHNPATGEKIKIKAQNAVKFRPGKSLKDLVNNVKA